MRDWEAVARVQRTTLNFEIKKDIVQTQPRTMKTELGKKFQFYGSK